LERQRTERADEIQRAILKAAKGPFPFDSWLRIVDFNRSMHPLSAKGSIVTDPGGRFNIGDIDESLFPTFPALYLASDHETALAEKFAPAGSSVGLSQNDFALRPRSSYASLLVRGEVESVIDLREPDRLEPLIEIIKTFDIPSDLPRRARTLRLEDPSLVRSASELISVLTTVHWRIFPMQFDVPATPQIFVASLPAQELKRFSTLRARRMGYAWRCSR